MTTRSTRRALAATLTSAALLWPSALLAQPDAQADDAQTNDAQADDAQADATQDTSASPAGDQAAPTASVQADAARAALSQATSPSGPDASPTTAAATTSPGAARPKRVLPPLNVGGDGGGLSLPPELDEFDGAGAFIFDSDARNPGRDRDKRWRLLFGGYVRTMYKAISNDPNQPLIGANDGFLLANARPTFTGVLKNGLGFRLQMELAADLGAQDTTTPARQMVMRPRDTYIFYQPSSHLEVQVGQFKPPHDLEGLMSTGAVVFAERSVGSRGIRPFEAQNPVQGLSVDREVGVQALGQYFPTDERNRARGPGVRYAIAVTNGSPSEQTFNDNDSLAYYGRASLHWGDYVSVGGGVMSNSLLIGTPPDQNGVERTSVTGDLYVHAAGVHAFASVQRQTDKTTLFGANNPPGQDTFVTSLAYQAQLGYHIPVVHLMPTVRYAHFDPTSTFNEVAVNEPGLDVRTIDAVTHLTLGLNYVAATYPIQVMLNYTIVSEQDAARQLDNDQLELLLQMTW